jgi:hypothetical protein
LGSRIFILIKNMLAQEKEVKEFMVLAKSQSFYSLPKRLHLAKKDS